ncbi:hypothetical protein BKA82DRAFT_4340599 [Pisolithus tinctorius]|nr:hypothetical protein BKA82DRAFT_4340599 [Pisolithus tinctorius]
MDRVGLDALGWSVVTFVVSVLLGCYQSIFIVYYGAFGVGDLNRLFVASTAFWMTFLGLPTWLWLYQNYVARVEHQELLALLNAFNDVNRLRRRMLPPPPPHYLHFHIPDVDRDADLDPVPLYTEEGAADPPPPQRVPTPLPEEVEQMNEALAGIAIAENHDLAVNPDLAEMSLVVAKRVETQIAEHRDGMYEDGNWRKYFVKETIEYIEGLYVRDCATWREAVPSTMSYFKKPPTTAFVPISTLETSWEVMPSFPGIDSPYFCPGLHVAAHGYFVDFAPKYSYQSSPHAIANFNGCDLPSVTYEDPALFTVPATTITHDTFVSAGSSRLFGFGTSILSAISEEFGLTDPPIFGASHDGSAKEEEAEIDLTQDFSPLLGSLRNKAIWAPASDIRSLVDILGGLTEPVTDSSLTGRQKKIFFETSNVPFRRVLSTISRNREAASNLPLLLEELASLEPLDHHFPLPGTMDVPYASGGQYLERVDDFAKLIFLATLALKNLFTIASGNSLGIIILNP